MATEELVSLMSAVRKRPGMYVGDVTTGVGVLHMVLSVVASARDQHFTGTCSTIAVEVAADGTITVEDDGPGLPVHGGDGLPPIDRFLTSWWNLGSRRQHVHHGLVGLGLFVVNALSERFEVTTIRGGVEARMVYARGELVEPLAMVPTTRPSGTRIRFRPDPQICLCSRVPRTALTQRLEDLSFLLPQLRLRWQIVGDDAAAGGLASRVAVGVPCAPAEVASHRMTFAAEHGTTIEVEVALAWRDPRWHANEAPAIDSFVNLERSRHNGTHVAGLFDGVAAFLGRDRSAKPTRGLVAAVSVLLPSARWRNSTRDSLASPEARAPVAEATRVALARWAEAYPDAATALREHKRRRSVPDQPA